MLILTNRIKTLAININWEKERLTEYIKHMRHKFKNCPKDKATYMKNKSFTCGEQLKVRG